MTIELGTFTLPAAWASAIINHDYSGLEPDEAARCTACIEALARDGWAIVDVARDDTGEANEPRFTRHYHLYDPHECNGVLITGGDVLDYVAHSFASARR